jgi:hypothetical protein
MSKLSLSKRLDVETYVAKRAMRDILSSAKEKDADEFTLEETLQAFADDLDCDCEDCMLERRAKELGVEWGG